MTGLAEHIHAIQATKARYCAAADQCAHDPEGARTALPIWIHFMREALKGVPDKRRPMPDGLVQLRVSARTGALVGAENPDGIMETFMADHLPAGEEAGSVAQGAEGGAQSGEPIF